MLDDSGRRGNVANPQRRQRPRRRLLRLPQGEDQVTVQTGALGDDGVEGSKLAERSLAEWEARMKGERVVSPRLRWVS
jgi:hypothetical protein